MYLLELWLSQGACLVVGLLCHAVFLVFLRNLHTVLHSGCKLPCSTGSSDQCSEMPLRGGMGEMVGREVQEGGHVCIHIADSHSCTAETNITL